MSCHNLPLVTVSGAVVSSLGFCSYLALLSKEAWSVICTPSGFPQETHRVLVVKRGNSAELNKDPIYVYCFFE